MSEETSQEKQELTVEQQLDAIVQERALLGQALEETRNRNTQLQNALALTSAQNNQLVANLEVVRAQRDLFMEREADAAVNAKIADIASREQLVAQQRRTTELQKASEAFNARLNQSHSALEEVRTKFGDAKHKEKVAQRETQQALARESQTVEAVNWYLKTALCDNSRIDRAFRRRAGCELTTDVIVRAHSLWQIGNPEPVSVLDALLEAAATVNAA